MASNPTLLFIAWELTRGGAAYMAVRHMRRLISRYDIDLLITGPADSYMLSHLPEGVRVFRLEMGHLNSAAYSLGQQDSLGGMELFLLRQSIEPLQRDYHAVLATTVFRDWRASMAVSLARSPRKLVFLVDEALSFFPDQSPRGQSAVEACLLSADLVLPVCEKLWRKMTVSCPVLAQRPFEKMFPPITEPSPEPVSGPLPLLPRDLPVALTAARLVPDKNIMECVRVHGRLRRAGIDFRWYTLGAGPEEPRLRAEIQKWGLEDRFFLMGHDERMYEWLAQCDFFAFFSKSEGCPTVVLEALKAGKPVVMTDGNGADEMIENERTGLIIPDDPAAMEAALSRFLRNPELISTFSRNLKDRPSLSDTAKETERLIGYIEDRSPGESTPLVSILIPTYNQAEFLDQAISSALMQNFPTLEVLVLDDASTDGTPALIQKWKADPRFRYVRNEGNLGRVANYRKGIAEHARGDWALMLDGDDYLTDPSFITRAWEAVRRRKGRKILFAQAGHRVCYRDRKEPEVDILPPMEGPEKILSGGDYINFVFETNFFTHLGILFDRQEAVRKGCYTADVISSDMDSFLRLALEGEVILLNTIAGCWVQHGKNTSSRPVLSDIPATTRIFRQIAQSAVERGLASKAQLEPALSRYEAQTLAYLFNQSLAHSEGPGFPWIKIWSVALSVNPRLLMSFRFTASYFRMVRKFIKKRLKSMLPPFKAGHLSGKESA
jgi:glycosyltransferase involved in cell wall biosynthesis